MNNLNANSMSAAEYYRTVREPALLAEFKKKYPKGRLSIAIPGGWQEGAIFMSWRDTPVNARDGHSFGVECGKVREGRMLRGQTGWRFGKIKNFDSYSEFEKHAIKVGITMKAITMFKDNLKKHMVIK